MYGGGLKHLEELTRAEPRSLGLDYIPDRGEPQRLTLELYHQLVASLALDPPVDLVLHPHFDVARNLLLYAWFESSFTHPAELQAFGSLELGLRLWHGGWKSLRRGPMLGELLREAVDLGVFRDEDLHPYPELTGFGAAWSRDRGASMTQEQEAAESAVRRYIDIICEAVPVARNRLAHGHPGWAGTAFATLGTCRDLLNRLALVEKRGADHSPKSTRAAVAAVSRSRPAR